MRRTIATEIETSDDGTLCASECPHLNHRWGSWVCTRRGLSTSLEDDGPSITRSRGCVAAELPAEPTERRTLALVGYRRGE